LDAIDAILRIAQPTLGDLRIQQVKLVVAITHIENSPQPLQTHGLDWRIIVKAEASDPNTKKSTELSISCCTDPRNVVELCERAQLLVEFFHSFTMTLLCYLAQLLL